MFATLFRWELRALRRDAAFWIALALGVMALAFALVNGVRWRAHLDEVRVAAAQHETAVREGARRQATRIDAGKESAPFVSRDPRNPYGYANGIMAHFAILPATPLAALTVGQSDLLPSTLPLTPGTAAALAGSTEPENPHRLLIGRFDAAFAVVFLAPLLIIALTHALLAGERERGTLALLLAQPLTLRVLLIGRLAPRVLLTLALLGGLMLAFLSFDAPSARAWPRLMLWFAIALGYGAFWFALSVAIIARGTSAATSAVVLAAWWLALAVLVPATINLVVKTLHPAPSRIELILALREATDATSTERSKMLAAYYEDHPEFLPAGGAKAAADDYGTLRQITSEKIERDLAPVLARYDAQLARQQALVEKLQFLSPALLAASAFADAAGTGLARHRAFLAQAEAHRAELQAFFNPRILRKEKFSAWDDVPAFRYMEEPTSTLARQVAPALALLFSAALVLGFVGWQTLRHYPLAD